MAAIMPYKDNIFDASYATHGSDLSNITKILDIGYELLWEPDRLVSFEHWVGHIPFIFWLMKIIKPRHFVELGTHRGNSYCAMCQAVVSLNLSSVGMAIDTWDGDVHMAHEEGIFDELSSYHNPRYGSFSTLNRTTFDDARSYFSDASIDLLHIDGTHTYDSVRHDFELWLPTLSQRGIILFHDIEVRRDSFGVWRLWEELSAKYPHFSFRHSYGLGVLAVGQERTSILDTFLNIEKDQDYAALVRSLFVMRGSALVDHLMRRESEKKTTSLITTIEERDRTIIDLQDSVVQKQAKLDNLEKTIDERNLLVAELQNTITQHHTNSSSLERAIEERDLFISGLLTSRSWRITRPLRSMSQLLRGGILSARNVFMIPRYRTTRAGTSITSAALDNINAAPETNNEDIMFHIDSLMIVDSTIYTSGWVFRTSCSINVVELGLTTTDSIYWMTLQYGQPSPDIENNCIDQRWSSHCRFIGRADAPSNTLIERTCYLRLTSIDSYGVTHIKILNIYRSARSTTMKEVDNASFLQNFLRNIPVTVFIDHNMGGGANLCRINEVKELNADQRVAIVLSFTPIEGYMLRMYVPSKPPHEQQLRSSDEVFTILDNLQIAELVVNNLVSYPDPLRFLFRITHLRARRPEMHLRVMVHDYYMICPSWRLEDYRGEFCGIPDKLAECGSCMSRTRGEFLALAPRTPPKEWRKSLLDMLMVADEIRFFSNSSADLFEKVYPYLSNKFKVIPHSLCEIGDPFPGGHAGRNKHGRWTVASIGNIYKAKGSFILFEIQNIVRSRGIPIDIIVIGEVTDPACKNEIAATGPYNHSELAQLLRENEVSVVVLPFTWPETFSYTTNEICELGVPIVVSNIGAPAERVASYEMGMAVDINAESMLYGIISLLRLMASYPW